VPVLFVGREPDYVAGVDVVDGAALELGPAGAGGDDEGLAEGVGVPGGAGTGFEGNAGGGDEGGVGGLEEWVDADGAGEPIGWSLAGWLRANAFDFQVSLLRYALVLGVGCCWLRCRFSKMFQRIFSRWVRWQMRRGGAVLRGG